ncbi:uncharacterized protein [Haliotis asinina]|uniref:uncharacterized protein n=1 Tax=Haliotis asinina TaxID=109174 RepID=UPI003532642A
MDCLQVVLYILLLLNLKSVKGKAVFQVIAQVGIVTCKKRCIDNSACSAVAYDIERMSCEMYWSGKRQEGQGRSDSLTWVDMKRGKGHTKSNCHLKFQSSVLTHSQRTVCLLKLECVACLDPPEVDNANVRLKVYPTEVMATYSCWDDFKSIRQTSFTITCNASKPWPQPPCGCASTAHVREDDIVLPVGLKGKREVTVCGTPNKGLEFSINFMRGENILFHMKPTYDAGKNRNVIVFNALVDNHWKRQTAEDEYFPFTEQKEFCVGVYRHNGTYVVKIDGKKFSYSDCAPNESPNVVRLSEGVINSKVTMAY